MTTLEILKNSLIDKILVTNNESLLKAISTIFDSTQKEEKIKLSSEQLEMLLMSENDIKSGKIVSEAELQKMDKEWLN